MDVDLGPPARRAAAAPGHPGSAARPVVRRGGGVHRRLHGPARRVHRHRRAPDPAAHLRRLGRRRHLGRPVVPPGAGGDGHRGRALRRHVGAQAPLRLRLPGLRRRLGAVRPGTRPGRAVRLPRPAGRRGGDAAGEQPGHHRARGAGPIAREGHRAPGDGPGARARPGPFDRRPAPGRRRVAPHLLRQRPRRPGRRHHRCRPGAAEPEPVGTRALRLDRARDLLPCGGGALVRDHVRGGDRLGLGADRGPVRTGGRPGRAVPLARAPGPRPHARPGALPQRPVRRRGS